MVCAGCGLPRDGSDDGGGGLAPTADAGGDRSARPGESILFDGTASADPDGEIIAHDWSFGDGSESESGATASHTFVTTGVYTVVLTVTDDDDEVDSDSITVTITETGPEAAFSFSPNPAYVNEAVAFDASGSTTETTIVAYNWSFGDSTPAATGVSVAHTFDLAGSFRVTLEVEEEGGATAETFAWIEVRAGGLSLADVVGTYDVVPDPASRDCANYSVPFVDSVLTLSEGIDDGSCGANPVIDAAANSGRDFRGCLDGTGLTLTYEEASTNPGGGCTADLTASFNVSFDLAGHFDGHGTSFYDAGIGCQCTALFGVEGSRR